MMSAVRRLVTWLYDNTVKAGSPEVVTRQRYMGPMLYKT